MVEDSQFRRLMELAEKVQFVGTSTHELPRGVRLPEKDAPILLAAIEARANYLLTGDLHHFGPYFGKRIEGVTVILPGEYLKLRKRGD